MLDDLITVKEAIRRYKLSGTYFRRLLREGKIRGKKLGITWVIDPASIDSFLDKPRLKTGRPPIDKYNK